MIIRKASSKDLKQVAEIYAEVYSEGPYHEKWDSKMVAKKTKESLNDLIIYVAEIQKKIVGFIIFYDFMWDRGKRAYIEDMGVLKEYRGQGIASKLFKKAEEVLRKKGVSKIILDVSTKSKALKLYERIGYKKSGYVQMEKRLK
jgi:ribosomal protein S18 acetylase RimI-like enzyme